MAINSDGEQAAGTVHNVLEKLEAIAITVFVLMHVAMRYISSSTSTEAGNCTPAASDFAYSMKGLRADQRERASDQVFRSQTT